METYDLIEFFLPRSNKICTPNKIEESIEEIGNDTLVRNRYKGIGVCNVTQIIEAADLDKLHKYYLVWQKSGNRYHQYANTGINFRFVEYIDEFSYDLAGLPSSDKILRH